MYPEFDDLATAERAWLAYGTTHTVVAAYSQPGLWYIVPVADAPRFR